MKLGQQKERTGKSTLDYQHLQKHRTTKVLKTQVFSSKYRANFKNFSVKTGALAAYMR